MNQRKFIVLFFLFFVFSVFSQAHAQQFFGEHIRIFDTKVNIQKDGSMIVEEKIVYDFADDERHGIYREIPYIKTNTEGKKLKLKIDDISVRDEQGKNYKFVKEDENQHIRLKIGDPDKTITGVHTYIIQYKVEGALTYLSNHDELYWNVTGNRWNVPVAAAKARIILPDEVADEAVKLTCYTGSQGSNSMDCTSDFNQTIATFVSNGPFVSSEGLTVVLEFPKNMVAVLEPQEYVPFAQTLWGKILFTILLIGGSIAALFWYIFYPVKIILNWFATGRDPNVGKALTAGYDAPKTSDGTVLTPAEAGALVDETVDRRDISSSLLDLARRGYFKIEERKDKDFYFIKQKEADGKLLDFEAKLLNGIFSGADKEVRLKDKKLYKTIAEVEKQIYERLVAHTFFPKDPQKTRNFYAGIAAVAFTTFNLPLAAIALTFGRNMPQKTIQGARAANVARSLKNFLSSQERQLTFQAKNQLTFEKLLPFAVAFGVEKIWAERFKDVHLREPEWYTGYNHSTFNAVHFTDSFNSSVNTASMSPTSSSSGFSSGSSGGFSGGGGGGGGGGSW